jgi:hypothetical protein
MPDGLVKEKLVLNKYTGGIYTSWKQFPRGFSYICYWVHTNLCSITQNTPSGDSILKLFLWSNPYEFVETTRCVITVTKQVNILAVL